MKFLVFMQDGLVYGSSSMPGEKREKILAAGGTVFEDVPDPDTYDLVIDPAEPAGYRAKTEAEIAAGNASVEAARHAAKSVKLKTAENNYLSLIMGIGLAPNATSTDIFIKLAQIKAGNITIPFNGVKLTSVELGSLISALMHDVEVNGGSYAGLPSKLHS